MRNTGHLTATEIRVRAMLHGLSHEQLHELAGLALTIHAVRRMALSPQADQRLLELLDVIGPDLALVLKALDQAATRTMKNRGGTT